jgi:hypothetical protein
MKTVYFHSGPQKINKKLLYNLCKPLFWHSLQRKKERRKKERKKERGGKKQNAL